MRCQRLTVNMLDGGYWQSVRVLVTALLLAAYFSH